MSQDAQVTAQRLNRVREVMEQAGVDLLVIGPSSDFRYFTGHAPRLSERLTALIIPREGEATITVPRLEAPLLAPLRSLRHGNLGRDGAAHRAHRGDGA